MSASQKFPHYHPDTSRDRLPYVSSRVVRGGLLCLLFAGGIAVGAHADTGRVEITTYLRAGPGRQFTVLDEIGPGGRVEVQSCQGEWCQVTSGGAPGYVEAKVLHGPDIHVPAPQQPAGADCFAARLNGPPRGDAERFCSK